MRIHQVRPLQRILIESPQLQALLEQLTIDGELDTTCKMLSSDERLDGPSDEPLFVHIDERLELHGWRQRSKSGEHVWMGGVYEVSVLIDAGGFVRGRRINKIRELTISVQWGEVYA